MRATAGSVWSFRVLHAALLSPRLTDRLYLFPAALLV
jgi:hypothetical protein